jgi:PKD repeat protein
MRSKLVVISLVILAILLTSPVVAVSTWNVSYAVWNSGNAYRNVNLTTTNFDSPTSVCGMYGVSPWAGYSNKLETDMVYYTQSIPAWGEMSLSGEAKELTYSPATNWTQMSDGWYYPVLLTGAACNWYGNWRMMAGKKVHYYNGTQYAPADSGQNFTGYPLDGYAPLNVVFTTVNITNTSSLTWSFGDGTVTVGTTTTINHTYANPGIYTVSLNYFNSSGYPGTITKSNYVLASLASGMIVNLDVKDATSGALIQDSTVGIRNTSSGVWRNTTAPTGLVYFSTTDPGYLYPLTQGQSITLAANKTGYKDASETFAIPYNNYRARLFLMPLNVINATGTGTVVVNTIRNKDGLTISGISVVLDSGQMGITNTAGATTLYNVTAGTRYVTVTDPDKGYQDTKSSFNLSAGETKLVVIQMVRVGEEPVVTPVSPTPTPTRTYDPKDPTSPVYGNYTTSQINEQGGAGVLGMLAQLIGLWPLVVVGVLMKFMKSAFS